MRCCRERSSSRRRRLSLVKKHSAMRAVSDHGGSDISDFSARVTRRESRTETSTGRRVLRAAKVCADGGRCGARAQPAERRPGPRLQQRGAESGRVPRSMTVQVGAIDCAAPPPPPPRSSPPTRRALPVEVKHFAAAMWTSSSVSCLFDGQNEKEPRVIPSTIGYRRHCADVRARRSLGQRSGAISLASAVGRFDATEI